MDTTIIYLISFINTRARLNYFVLTTCWFPGNLESTYSGKLFNNYDINKSTLHCRMDKIPQKRKEDPTRKWQCFALLLLLFSFFVILGMATIIVYYEIRL
jgi:hypothetical protein